MSALSIVVPLLGFPGSWDKVFAVIVGLITLFVSVSLYREKTRKNEVIVKNNINNEQNPVA